MPSSKRNELMCLIPGCPYHASAGIGRGLCVQCYEAARDTVLDGTTTWEQLERAGLSLRKTDPFTIALNKLKSTTVVDSRERK